ncbi:MAG: 1,4-dihydroxy-2-naphthoate polyprenyltransferase [Acidimicrobiales bacterium]
MIDKSSVRHPWFLGARPRTLPASAVPVLVGTGAAAAYGHTIWWRALLAGAVAVSLQVGVNYANDYSDGVRGTDAVRVGPLRLVASGTAMPGAVKRAALIAFVVAGVAGLALAAVAGWWLVAVGIACVAAAWFYTGGPRPYGYAGLGEVSVFAFFGVVATVGTAYVQTERVTGLELLTALPVGLLAVSLLVVNNLRDIPGDTAAGKRTLAVRLGPAATRRFYEGCVVGALVALVPIALTRPWALLGLAAVPLAALPVRSVAQGAQGPALIPVLGATGRAQLALGVLLAIGLAL